MSHERHPLMSQALYDLLYSRRDGFGPDAELSRLRTEEPITRISLPWGAEGWLVTRYADVRAVLGDATRFSSALPSPVPGQSSNDETGQPRDQIGFLLVYDPPAHSRLRRYFAAGFTEARMRSLRPSVEAIVNEHLDLMERAGPPADLVSAFALPVPSLVICELLGVPHSDRAEFQVRSHKRLSLSITAEERAAISRESLEYMKDLVVRKRKEPDENMLGLLIRQHGDEISDDELAGVGDLLLFNGHESTASMLGIGTLLLLRHPQQHALLRDDPDSVNPAVEELLRYLSVVNSAMPRTAVADVTIAGQLVKAGETVFCSLSTADRDGDIGADPDALDITRKVIPNVAFGHGIHYCVGAPLARMEMRIAYPALLRRFPNLRLAVAPEDVPFRPSSFVHGVEALPVEW
jgi:cytochrome P450